jgi:hypothetical protein
VCDTCIWSELFPTRYPGPILLLRFSLFISAKCIGWNCILLNNIRDQCITSFQSVHPPARLHSRLIPCVALALLLAPLHQRYPKRRLLTIRTIPDNVVDPFPEQMKATFPRVLKESVHDKCLAFRDCVAMLSNLSFILIAEMLGSYT